MNDTREVGRLGEQLAENFLKQKNYEIINKNFWCKFGEIDLVAVDKEYIVFIEVKTARSKKILPQENITYQKKERIIKVANYYITRFNLEANYRFDVITVQLQKRKQKFNLIKNAFGI